MNVILTSPQLKATINSFGAELCSVKNKDDLEIIWQANKTIWARHAPVLFPIVGKLNNNSFVYNDKNYELSQHGFARDLEFRLLDATTNSCTFELKATDTTKKRFPFDFVFQINYSLKQNSLITTYTVSNPATNKLLFSVGAHPGFNCPLLPNEKMEDYYLEFEKNHLVKTQLDNGLRLNTKEELILTNQKLPLKKELFDKDAMVFENYQINTISLCSSKSKHKITLECKNWPYFGIWTKRGNESFVCLEPWYGIADSTSFTSDFSKKQGLIALSSNQQFVCEYSLTFN